MRIFLYKLFFCLLFIMSVVAIACNNPALRNLHCANDPLLNESKKYFWLFDTADTAALKCEYPFGNRKLEKNLFLYTLMDHYRYLIIEDRHMNAVFLDSILNVQQKINVNEGFIYPSAISDLFWGGHLYFQARLCTDSSNRLILSIDGKSKMNRISGRNQIMLKGKCNQVLIKNEKDQYQYLIKFDKEQETGLVFYRIGVKLYFIIVNCFDGFDDLDAGIEKLGLN